MEVILDFLGRQSRDVYALCEFSRTDLQKLEKALSLVEVKFNSEIQQEKEASDYLVNDFYPKIQQELKQIEEEYGPAPDKETD